MTLLYQFNMFCVIKYVITILLFYELSNGEVIQECFGLRNFRDYHGYDSFSRESAVQVYISCDNGFIRLGDIVYSIPKKYFNLCPDDGCSMSQGNLTCNCCKVRLYPTDECKVKFFPSNQEKQFCESYTRCKLTLEIVDLSLYCQDQLHYKCDKDCCKSRWVDMQYECVPGRTIEHLALITAFKEKTFTV